MRASCLNCTRKHLAKAYLLLCTLPVSGKMGPVQHTDFWLAVANLDEAEEETVLEYYNLTIRIRETVRLPLMDVLLEGLDFVVTARDRIREIIYEIDTRPEEFRSRGLIHTNPDPIRLQLALLVAKASILVKEAFTGYPAHLALAITELSQVRDQSTGLDRHATSLIIERLMKGDPTNVLDLLHRFIS